MAVKDFYQSSNLAVDRLEGWKSGSGQSDDHRPKDNFL